MPNFSRLDRNDGSFHSNFIFITPNHNNGLKALTFKLTPYEQALGTVERKKLPFSRKKPGYERDSYLLGLVWGEGRETVFFFFNNSFVWSLVSS